MADAPTNQAEFQAFLEQEIGRIRSPKRRGFIVERLTPVSQTTLHWEYGNDEPFPAWEFADLKERNVVAQYCVGGHGALGSPWGINFRGDQNFGMDSGWYPSLDALIEDWGIEE
jgi:hypothetical protein